MKKYRRAIALFLAIGLMVLIPSGMGVSASGNTVEAKMSENIAQVLSMTGIEREEYSDQQVIDVDGQRVRQLVFDDNLKVDMDGANVKAISHFTACTNDAIVVYGEDDISETVNNIVEISDMDENYGKRQTSPRIKGRHLKETVAHRDGGLLFMRHMAFFRGICGKQLFSPCFIRFAQLRRVLQEP